MVSCSLYLVYFSTYSHLKVLKNCNLMSRLLSTIFINICVCCLFQPPRHQPPVVPHSLQSRKAFDLQPVQVAGHQNRHRPPAAGHAGSFPVQHAWLHGQENAGSLRCCSDASAEGSSSFKYRIASDPLSLPASCLWFPFSSLFECLLSFYNFCQYSVEVCELFCLHHCLMVRIMQEL